MPSRSQALDLCRRHAGAFLVAGELRLLHITAQAEERAEVLTILAALEFHADARGPVVVLPDAAAGPGRGWAYRVERLRAEHAARTEADQPLGPFVWSDEHTERDPIARFGAAARAMVDAIATMPESSSTLTLVLAPTQIEEPATWCAELRALLERPELAAVRWIVVDEGQGAPVAAKLSAVEGKTWARAHEVAPEPFDLGGLSASIEVAEDGTVDLRRFGRAGPKGVRPPARRGRDEPAPDATLDARLVLAAAAAAQSGDFVTAVKTQKAACDRTQQGPAEPHILCQMTLAGYLLAGGHPDASAAQYETAAQLAADAEHVELEAQARLARGAIFETQGQHREAVAEYCLAARGAEQGEQSAVTAICAWCAAGRHAESLGNNLESIGAYTEALRIARKNPDAATVADAPSIARQLAEVLRRVELAKQAALVDELAEGEPDESNEAEPEGEAEGEPDESNEAASEGEGG